VNLHLYLTIPEAWRPALMVADGMGVDSTAMLVLMWRLGIRPHAILHADTGDEHPETVAYREYRRAWLAAIGFPDLTIVKRAPPAPRLKKDGTPAKQRARRDGRENVVYTTLGENCIENKTLPSLAFGGKGCSDKWKIEPQDAWTETWGPALRTWGSGS